jgi:hypothetical protein
VAFHRGTCRGRRSYNAITWYFPQYGQKFNPHAYINACTGRYSMPRTHLVSCADVTVDDAGETASSVLVVAMSCEQATTTIAALPVASYLTPDGEAGGDRRQRDRRPAARQVDRGREAGDSLLNHGADVLAELSALALRDGEAVDELVDRAVENVGGEASHGPPTGQTSDYFRTYQLTTAPPLPSENALCEP